MSAKVFSISNQKGGTGKTTLSMNFAAGLARRGRTLLIDADPQGSAGQWSALASDQRPFPVSVIAVAGNLAREVNRFRQDYQYLVIDCPPTLETDTTRLAISVSDSILMPVLPSPIDLWASVRLAAVIEQAKLSNPNLRAHLVINQLEPRNALSRGMQQALAEFDIPSLKAGLRRRAIYRTSAIEGASVFCLGKRGIAAAQEIESIIEEVI
ncbi:MAG: ParA family partition ATPase [Pseudomonadota bacterium]|nr:ParA family partition ATPase [Pseudomonadota bacterium]